MRKTLFSSHKSQSQPGRRAHVPVGPLQRWRTILCGTSDGWASGQADHTAMGPLATQTSHPGPLKYLRTERHLKPVFYHSRFAVL